MFKMRDEKGIDDKIICVPLHDPYWNHYEELEDLPLPLRQEIEQFFSIYKDLEEGKQVSIGGWGSREEALHEVAASQRRRQAE
jgi:inorganic pyrophosphatase